MPRRSRQLYGYENPRHRRLTADSVGVAIVLQKCFDRFGLPGTIYFDNGKEFKNQFLYGGVWKSRDSMIDAEDLIRNIGVIVEGRSVDCFCQAV